MLNKKKAAGRRQRATGRGMSSFPQPVSCLFIVSAPSGTGKTTLCRKAVDYFPDLMHSISYTTRPPRKGEKDGIDYHFISKKVFQRMIDREEFLEWAEVHGNRYGTALKDTKYLIDKGLDIILDIDVQGAKKIKQQIAVHSMPFPVYIFILPPSLKVSEQRIRSRGGDSPKAISERLENARAEIRDAVYYDYLIINDGLEDAFERLKSIITAEKSRSERMMEKVKAVYKEII